MRAILQQQLLLKTLSLWLSLRKLGCGAPLHEATSYFGEEGDRQEQWDGMLEKARRGHEAKATCAGRILFEYDYQGRPYVR